MAAVWRRWPHRENIELNEQRRELLSTVMPLMAYESGKSRNYSEIGNIAVILICPNTLSTLCLIHKGNHCLRAITEPNQ